MWPIFVVFKEKTIEAPPIDTNKFTPNFKKNPDFYYANKNFYSAAPNQKEVDPEPKLIDAKVNAQENTNDQNIITIKIRVHKQEDFVEIDIDRNLSFEKFKQICIDELEIENEDLPIVKIRKLPNVLIRKTQDIKRLKNDQEIEFLLSWMFSFL